MAIKALPFKPVQMTTAILSTPVTESTSPFWKDKLYSNLYTYQKPPIMNLTRQFVYGHKSTQPTNIKQVDEINPITNTTKRVFEIDYTGKTDIHYMSAKSAYLPTVQPYENDIWSELMAGWNLLSITLEMKPQTGYTPTGPNTPTFSIGTNPFVAMDTQIPWNTRTTIYFAFQSTFCNYRNFSISQIDSRVMIGVPTIDDVPQGYYYRDVYEDAKDLVFMLVDSNYVGKIIVEDIQVRSMQHTTIEDVGEDLKIGFHHETINAIHISSYDSSTGTNNGTFDRDVTTYSLYIIKAIAFENTLNRDIPVTNTIVKLYPQNKTEDNYITTVNMGYMKLSSGLVGTDFNTVGVLDVSTDQSMVELNYGTTHTHEAGSYWVVEPRLTVWNTSETGPVYTNINTIYLGKKVPFLLADTNEDFTKSNYTKNIGV